MPYGRLLCVSARSSKQLKNTKEKYYVFAEDKQKLKLIIGDEMWRS